MRILFFVGLALLTTQCMATAPTVEQMMWHDGREAISILCQGEPAACPAQASEICPVGYETLDRKENGPNVQLIIRCK